MRTGNGYRAKGEPLHSAEWQPAISRQGSPQDNSHETPKTGIDVETAAMLRAWLLPDITTASDWADLSERLAGKGFHVGFVEGKLCLIARSSGVVICTFRFLGHGFAELRARLGRPHVLVRDGRRALGMVMH